MNQYGGPREMQRMPQPQQQQQGMRQTYGNTTKTVIENHIRHRLPTLVLKLQQNANNNRGQHQSHFGLFKKTPKDDKELDHLLEANLAEFKRELNENIDDFHQQVLSAKPHPSEQRNDPDGYAARMSAYQQFLQMANEIVKRLQQSFNAILNSYREYIERLWQAIQQGHDVRPMQQQFEEQLRYNMDSHWASIFKQADDLIRDINYNLAHARKQPYPSNVRQQQYQQ